ncbi:MAG TPA: hypothetical protein VIV27_09410, partial [Halioglobus sp.]
MCEALTTAGRSRKGNCRRREIGVSRVTLLPACPPHCFSTSIANPEGTADNRNRRAAGEPLLASRV